MQRDVIFDLSPDGFVSFDAARRVKYASPAFLHMTGLQEAALYGSTEEDFFRKLAQCRRQQAPLPTALAMRAELAKHATARIRLEFEQPMRRNVEIGLRLSSAQSVSQILYLRDVTHETEVDRMKSEFLSTAAHELRTPMTSIQGFSELLLTSEFDEATCRELLDIIFRQSQRIAQIVNELLDLARIEERRGKDFVLEALRLDDLVQSAVQDFALPAGRTAPEVAAAEGLLRVSADRSKLTQVLGNLLSNAYKYSPGGGPVSIRYVADRVDDVERVGMEIRDAGIGMTP